jgi:hypothetical protein
VQRSGPETARLEPDRDPLMDQAAGLLDHGDPARLHADRLRRILPIREGET